MRFGDLGAVLKTAVYHYHPGYNWIYTHERCAYQEMAGALGKMLDTIAEIKSCPEYAALKDFADQNGYACTMADLPEEAGSWRQAIDVVSQARPAYTMNGHEYFDIGIFKALADFPQNVVAFFEWCETKEEEALVLMQAYAEAGHEYDGPDMDEDFAVLVAQLEHVPGFIEQAEDEIANHDRSRGHQPSERHL